MKEQHIYSAKNKIRIVSAASLFDGHDAAINIMRRVIQASGAEVIHLGHNRSAQEIVECAICEDAQAIAVTSYQGGHMEFFKYMYDLLKEKNCSHIKIFGGGGGVILPFEAQELHDYGIARIYSPDDGRSMGLQGMINDLLEKCDFPVGKDAHLDITALKRREQKTIANLISAVENYPNSASEIMGSLRKEIPAHTPPILGITGTGGSGKSSIVDEIVCRFLNDFQDKSVAIISVDPSKRKTGGALLGDRIRMNSIHNPRIFMRSLATRQSNLALSRYVKESLEILKAAEFSLIILETSGIGQSDTEITEHSDISLYIMTPEYGAGTQLEKIDMLDYADLIVINKFDKNGAADALRDVKKQFKRNRNALDWADDTIPVFGTIASQFNDPGTNLLYKEIISKISKLNTTPFESRFELTEEMRQKKSIIPNKRVRYLAEISETITAYNKWSKDQSHIASKLYGIKSTIEALEKTEVANKTETIKNLAEAYKQIAINLDGQNKKILETWQAKTQNYTNDQYTYVVRDKEVKIDTKFETLSHSRLPKISVPKYHDWGDILHWSLQENVPGEFPYTAGVFPFKRENEAPTRMFAGEGSPERTNKRFHYVSKGQAAKRLSTAFDSVTLYGENPDLRPDIYGKIGNAGVSICCLDDAKKLYSGFNLIDPMTSVSMTINGPASIMTAYFMNTAIDQQCEIYIKQSGLTTELNKKIDEIYRERKLPRPTYNGDIPEGNEGLGLMMLGITGDQVLPAEIYEKIKADTISKVRGTIQADILKEDQAQNTCIFSTEFSLKLMGDMQQYFIQNNVRNFYSVSISGYHIAEAGANPITQLAFTLANGFTYLEYYLSRGMDIDAFAPNLSFFFSNGMEPEYAVIGRVARRIWAKALKLKYGGNARSQMLKYHIQTSGRSLHAQEIDFNDIRTTLQGLYAIFDNCNSLHTNAYDEAITTPTEESVRRAIAIQLIINTELGVAKNQNPWQGSFMIEELTDLVEQAVLEEFERISERGGVLGAMETMYQRSKVQEESIYYETLKHSGDYPIIGVNTFLSSQGSPTVTCGEVIRATLEEKNNQINTLKNLHLTQEKNSKRALSELQQCAINNNNLFEKIMEVSKYCSLGQITHALYAVGGQYRRNM